MHGPGVYTREASSRFVSNVNEIASDFMERKSVEYADVLVSPSKFMMDWVKENKWKYPPRVEFIQNVIPPLDSTELKRYPLISWSRFLSIYLIY
jgi:hypothetical protein